MSRRAKPSRTAAPKVQASDLRPVRRSWTALLAASTLGVAGASMVHADVQSDAGLAAGRSYRLIVQSYDQAEGATFDPYARPLASTQRSITDAELREGVRVGLLELRQDRRDADDSAQAQRTKPVVVAWVEEGRADLELDGLRARPQPGSLRGAAPRPGALETAQISVRPLATVS
jgi:hypothetical protein